MKCDCGSTGFWISYKAAGAWKQIVDFESGKREVVETNIDDLRYLKEPKTMFCADCGKKHRNPASD